MTRPVTGVVMDRTTLSRLSSSLQRLMEEHYDLDFLHSLNAELLSQLAGPYASAA